MMEIYGGATGHDGGAAAECGGSLGEVKGFEKQRKNGC